ncbi:hypothetical protein [Treponema lecithinolyticum]
MEQLEFFTETQAETENDTMPALPYFDTPVTDNEKLLNMQYELYHKNKKQAIEKMYRLCLVICRRMVNLQMRKKKIKLSDAEEKSHDAAMYVLSRYMQPDSTYIIKKNFIAALHDAVFYILFHRRKVDLIVDFIDPNDLQL